VPNVPAARCPVNFRANGGDEWMRKGLHSGPQGGSTVVTQASLSTSLLSVAAVFVGLALASVVVLTAVLLALALSLRSRWDRMADGDDAP
jgi:hypothetical protein